MSNSIPSPPDPPPVRVIREGYPWEGTKDGAFRDGFRRYRWIGVALILIFTLLLPGICWSAAIYWGAPITWESAYTRAGYILISMIYAFGKWRK